MLPRRRLGELLVERGLITSEQLETALAAQKKEEHGRIGSILVQLGYISEEELLKFLSLFYDVPQVDLRHTPISAEALCLLSAEKARACGVLPFRLLERPPDRSMLFVATPDPANFDSLDMVRTATGREIEPFVCSFGAFEEAFRRAYGKPASTDGVRQTLQGVEAQRLVEIVIRLLVKKNIITLDEVADAICDAVGQHGDDTT